MAKRLRILLVEDDSDDVQLLEEAFQDNQVPVEWSVIMEGDKVIPYLLNSSVLPDVLIMDLNLPKLHGKDLLREIRSNHHFSALPIIVLSTSASPRDRDFATHHGAHCFITKPSSLNGFNVTVKAIMDAICAN